MSTHPTAIVTDGQRRLQEAIEAEVRRAFELELASEPDHWRKMAIEDRIKKEIARQLAESASPGSLWTSA